MHCITVCSTVCTTLPEYDDNPRENARVDFQTNLSKTPSFALTSMSPHGGGHGD